MKKMYEALEITLVFFGFNILTLTGCYLYRNYQKKKPVLQVSDSESYIPLMESKIELTEDIPIDEQQCTRIIRKPDTMISSSILEDIEAVSSDSSSSPKSEPAMESLEDI